MKTKLFFPLETTARELDHKIMMGVLSASKTRDVYIGDQQILRNLSFITKKGIFYGKHLFGKPSFSDMEYYERLKRNNFKIIHLNEEGAIWAGTESEWQDILKQCERPSKLKSDDYLATWGDWQKQFNLSYENPTVSIEATGHPKFDLYREKYRDYFKKDIDELKVKYGDFILINTAFSLSNNGKGGNGFIFKNKLSYDPKNRSHRDYLFRDWRNQSVSMANIVYLINELNLAFPDKKIIVRPHPSENNEYYKSVFQGIENVHVIYDGSVSPWILACELLIHNGCTTAIEASLANKPVINYANESDREFEVFLASLCGVRCTEPKQVISLIESSKWSYDFIPKSIKGNSLFKNFSEENSSENVIKLIDKAEGRLEESHSKLDYLKFNFITKFHYIYLASKFIYLLFKRNTANTRDYLKRFERFEIHDINEKVNLMAKILNKNVKVKWSSKFLFVITHDEK